MDVHRIDPSLALAFYLPNRASFRDLTKKIAEVTPSRHYEKQNLKKLQQHSSTWRRQICYWRRLAFLGASMRLLVLYLEGLRD